MDKELKMKKSLLIILFAILIVSCDFKQKPPTKITKEYLSGKEFVADIGIMGTKYFVFTNTDEVYKVAKEFLDIRHKIGKIYELKTTKAE